MRDMRAMPPYPSPLKRAAMLICLLSLPCHAGALMMLLACCLRHLLDAILFRAFIYLRFPLFLLSPDALFRYLFLHLLIIDAISLIICRLPDAYAFRFFRYAATRRRHFDAISRRFSLVLLFHFRLMPIIFIFAIRLMLATFAAADTVAVTREDFSPWRALLMR